MVEWTVGGAVAGQVKSGGGLTFLAVEGAGHMVPMDQPANVRTLMLRHTLTQKAWHNLLL
jgi:carboxypeptidase C (cathepsin A)